MLHVAFLQSESDRAGPSKKPSTSEQGPAAAAKPAPCAHKQKPQKSITKASTSATSKASSVRATKPVVTEHDPRSPSPASVASMPSGPVDDTPTTTHVQDSLMAHRSAEGQSSSVDSATATSPSSVQSGSMDALSPIPHVKDVSDDGSRRTRSTHTQAQNVASPGKIQLDSSFAENDLSFDEAVQGTGGLCELEAFLEVSLVCIKDSCPSITCVIYVLFVIIFLSCSPIHYITRPLWTSPSWNRGHF
jgi:hypothetical protein